jgi:DNA modification methylase
VLDPFAGGAQTSLACLARGRHYVGVDIDQAYIDLGERRIADYSRTISETFELAV